MGLRTMTIPNSVCRLLACIVLAVLPVCHVGADVSGRARVVDGDSLVVSGQQIRLHGIDAPEANQSCVAAGRRWQCGLSAARALDERIGGGSVSCAEEDRDRYGRIVAVCRVGGADLNAWMVAQGFALAYRHYSRAYVGEEHSAKAARRGVWQGQFVEPWKWRRGERLALGISRSERPTGEGMGEGWRNDSGPRSLASGTSRSKGATGDRWGEEGWGEGRGDDSGDCRIKGNISRSGERIYHVPGGMYYGRTRISPSKGERWFCSEREARAAGWRKARQ